MYVSTPPENTLDGVRCSPLRPPKGGVTAYTYNALGARTGSEQIRKNENAGYQNANLFDGSGGVDYMLFLKDSRAFWQRAWESEVGTTHQNDFETVTTTFIPDYLSLANRAIMAA